MVNTERVPNKRLAVPTMDKVPTYKIGPHLSKFRGRTIAAYIVMCVVGVMPYLLNQLNVVTVSPALQAAGWGLFIPGGALIASGTLWGLILGLVTFVFFVSFGMNIMLFTGITMLNAYIWIMSIFAGAALAHSDTPVFAWVLILAIIVGTIIVRTRFANKKHADKMQVRKIHETHFKEDIAAVETNSVEAQPREERELDEDALKGTRYIFDMTLRELGDFSGYQSVEQSTMTSLRYSLDYLGYALAILQCHYTPNFHGYLNQAQRFVIESFTLPEVCSYWKWSYFGAEYRWNPDPVANDNVMFTGWSGIPIAAYGANTGDLRYEKPGALKFKTSKKSNKIYDYSSTDIINVLADQYRDYRTKLFACEPNWVFPVCNAFGWNALLIHDRQYQTNKLESVYDGLEKAMNEDFVEPSGDLCYERNTAFGFRSLEFGGGDIGEVNGLTGFGLVRLLNAVDPGLAKRTYMFSKRDNAYYDENGKLKTTYGEWDNIMDAGNFKKSPGSVISAMAASACEMGDRKFIEDLFEVAEEYMDRVDDKNVIAYKNASVIGNAQLAYARYAQKNDWYNMIHNGPGDTAFTGPLLTECRYPNVLVARAMSEGDDLDLVLYNGLETGTETIGIERLKPEQEYMVEGTDIHFASDSSGKANLNIHLDGRTKCHIVPA